MRTRLCLMLVLIAGSLTAAASERGRVIVYGGQNYDVYLGEMNLPSSDPNSIWNPWGAYGSKESPSSMWNPFGMYGNEVSPYSPWNPYASFLPGLFTEHGFFTGYLYGENGELKIRKSTDDPRKRKKTPRRPLLTLPDPYEDEDEVGEVEVSAEVIPVEDVEAVEP